MAAGSDAKVHDVNGQLWGRASDGQFNQTV